MAWEKGRKENQGKEELRNEDAGVLDDRGHQDDKM